MKKMLIWSSESEFDEDFREEFITHQKEKFGEDYEPSEEEINEDWAELNGIYLEDERRNLDVNVDGVIIAFADLGLWNGRRKGYQIYKSNISDILYSECDGAGKLNGEKEYNAIETQPGGRGVTLRLGMDEVFIVEQKKRKYYEI